MRREITRFSEFRYWSPVFGGDAARISKFDMHGSEYFVMIPDVGGGAYRELRTRALEAIDDAMIAGDQPGEVTV